MVAFLALVPASFCLLYQWMMPLCLASPPSSVGGWIMVEDGTTAVGELGATIDDLRDNSLAIDVVSVRVHASEGAVVGVESIALGDGTQGTLILTPGRSECACR